MLDSDATLEQLRSLPFITAVFADELTETAAVQTPAGVVELDLRVERSFLSSRTVDDIVALPRARPLLLLAPLVSGGAADRLKRAGVNYLDGAGNMHLVLRDHYVALVEGKQLPPATRPSGLRSAGYRVLFAWMAWPELAGRSTSEIAAWAGTSRTAVASLLRGLGEDGHLIGKGQRRRMVVGEELFRRWAVGYSDVLRPALFIKRYRMPEGGREVLQRRLEATVGDRFAWGGGMAAARLGGNFIGQRVTLHVRDSKADLPLNPDPDGQIHVLRIPGPLAWPGGSPNWDGGGVQAAHPLLVYAELLDQRDDRALEAAADLREQVGWVEP